MSKACSKCGEVQPLDEFYTHPMMADGHLNKCKNCTRSDVRANRAARIEYYQAYDRMRSKEPHRIAARVAYNKAHPKPRPETDPQKRAARAALGNAIRDGKMKKPPEVIWVCAACHALIHSYWRALGRAA
jgi:hypothetical protein